MTAALEHALQASTSHPAQPTRDQIRTLRFAECADAVCVCGHLLAFHRDSHNRQLSCVDAAVREIVALEQVGARH